MRRKTIAEYRKRLKEEGLLKGLSEESTTAGEIWQDRSVDYISYDSQDVLPGTLFVCKGANFREEYLEEALKKGAFSYLSERTYPVTGESEETPAPAIIVEDIRRSMAILADVYYDRIWEKLTTCGITGTKGKSTTTYFLRTILDEYRAATGKPPCAWLTGLHNYDGVIDEISHLTTPEAMMLHRHFYNAVNSGIDQLVMEVSSQALKYHRTWGITFDVGCFLNLGRDHISPVEHPSEEDYANSKMRLMKQCRVAIINGDSDQANRAKAAAKESAAQIITFGMREDADVRGTDLKPTEDGIQFQVDDQAYRIGLSGHFNVSNALAAMAMARALNIPEEFIRKGLEKARVPGRMERYTDPAGRITAIVDYAHNGMSLKALLETMALEHPGKKTIVVFGSTGGKAQSRRQELGTVAGAHADLAILTEDDPGEEKVETICKEIAGYVEKEGGRYEIIEDREAAIRRAVELADGDTIILVVGKGQETTQRRGRVYETVPSDGELVQKYLARA